MPGNDDASAPSPATGAPPSKSRVRPAALAAASCSRCVAISDARWSTFSRNLVTLSSMTSVWLAVARQ